MVLTLYRMYFFCIQMCNRLPELMKNGDAGIYPVYYSLKSIKKNLQNKKNKTQKNTIRYEFRFQYILHGLRFLGYYNEIFRV